MRAVFLFFALLVVLCILWMVIPSEVRKLITSKARKYLFPAVLFAAAITIALLAFAFFSTGKVI